MTQPKKTWSNRVIELIVVLAMITVMAMILRPSDLNWHRPSRQKIMLCGARLQILAAATVRYAQRHGTFPDDPKNCPEIRALDARCLICPASELESSTPRTDSAGARLDAAEQTSYVYVGRGVTNSASTDVAIWIEPLADHEGYGANVAYADGHVSWELTEVVQSLLQQAAAGTRPVRFPLGSTTQP